MASLLNKFETPFEKIILTTSQYNKCKLDDEEISLNGKMYDVKSVSFFHDTVELIVINDKDEASILKAIKDLVNNSGKSKLPDQLKQLITLNYLSEDGAYIVCIPVINIKNFNKTNQHFYTAFHEISTPPPKLV